MGCPRCSSEAGPEYRRESSPHPDRELTDTEILPGSRRPGRAETLGTSFPRVFGRFVLLRVIGQGGMGVVYEAEDKQLRRHVALKTISVESAGGEVYQRFEREAQIAGKLDHPNVVPVYDFGEIEGCIYYTMPLVSGLRFDWVIAHLHGHGKGPEPPWLRIPESPENRTDQILRWFEGALSGLHYAHQRGIVHRDLKPGNLLLDAGSGLLRIADFGLARAANLTTLTREHTLLGTIAYMAPEQVDPRHGTIDHRADVYSMGCTLYEALVDHLPYAADSVGGYLEKVTSSPPEPPEGLPAELTAVLSRALEKSPDARYPDAGALRDDLERYRRREPIALPPPGPRQRLVRGMGMGTRISPAARSKGNRTFWIGILAAAAVLAALGIVGRSLMKPLGPANAALAPRTIVVLPFNVIDAWTVNPDRTGQDFAENLVGNLKSMLSGARVSLSPNATYKSNPYEAAKSSGAGWTLTGVLEREPSGTTANLSLFDSSERSERKSTVTSKEQELGAFARYLALRVVSDLGGAPPKQYDFVDNLRGGPEMSNDPLSDETVGAIRQHDVGAGVRLTEQLARKYPEDPEAQTLRAFCLLCQYQQGRSKKAREELQDSLERLAGMDPQAPYAELFGGVLDRYLGHPRKGIERITHVLEKGNLTPQAEAWVLRTRAQIYIDTDDTGLALKDIEAARELCKDSHTCIALSRLYRKSGRVDDGLLEARRAVALDARSADAQSALAGALWEARQGDESLEAIKKACEISGSQEHCALLMLRLWKTGHKRDAEDRLRAVSESPRSPLGCYNLACYCALTGRSEPALQWLHAAFDEGYASKTIAKDSDLDSLRAKPEFDAIVTAVEKRIAPGNPWETP